MKSLRLLTIIFASVTAMILAGCSRKVYVQGETQYVNRVDTLWHERLRQDSVVLRDSVLIETHGDTVKQTIVRERWRTRTLTDTLRVLSRDTVRITVSNPIPAVLPEKEKKTRFLFSGLIVSFVIAGGIWLLYKKR